MIANAEEDRISSKKAVKSLKFNAPAPGTEQNLSLWVTRFEAFCEHVLHQSTSTPFTGDDVVRFFNTINFPDPVVPSTSRAHCGSRPRSTVHSSPFKKDTADIVLEERGIKLPQQWTLL